MAKVTQVNQCLLAYDCTTADTWEWSCPKVGGAVPPPLAAHGCAVLGSDVYIFGGLSPAGPGAMDQLYRLNTGKGTCFIRPHLLPSPNSILCK